MGQVLGLQAALGEGPTTTEGSLATQALPEYVRTLYTREVLAQLRSLSRGVVSALDHAGEPVRKRHLIFSGETLIRESLRLRREAWWRYLAHAAAHDLIDRDLKGRLTDTDDDNFRGAMAECLTSWFFAHKLGVDLRRHRVVSGPGPDFEGEVNLRVEVKAPHVPIVGTRWSGDDAGTLRECVAKAGKQFQAGMVNLVVVVPLLRTPLFIERNQLARALIGDHALSVPIALDDPSPDGEPTNIFRQNGKLAKLFPKKHGGFGSDLTRISAVIAIEEEFVRAGQGFALQHAVHVVQNPFTPDACRLGGGVFAEFPQLSIDDQGEMAWSDGAPVFP